MAALRGSRRVSRRVGQMRVIRVQCFFCGMVQQTTLTATYTWPLLTRISTIRRMRSKDKQSYVMQSEVTYVLNLISP